MRQISGPSGGYYWGIDFAWPVPCKNYFVPEYDDYDNIISLGMRDCTKCKYRLFQSARGNCGDLKYTEVEYTHG